MVLGRRLAWWGLALFLVSMMGSGCRDGDPPSAHNRNLGDADSLLLPVRSARVDPDLKDGTAEWYEFPEFNAEQEAAGDEPADGGGSEIETEIRELISEYNELVAERTLDDILEYHIEEQHETIAALYEVKFTTLDKLAEVKAAFEEKLPEAGERVADRFAPLEVAADVELVVDSLTTAGDSEVTGNLPAGSTTSTCRFVVVEEDWYIEFPQLPEFAQVKPSLDNITAACDGWLQSLQSGERAAEEVLAEVEAFVRALPPGPDAADEAAGTDKAGTPADEVDQD